MTCMCTCATELKNMDSSKAIISTFIPLLCVLRIVHLPSEARYNGSCLALPHQLWKCKSGVNKSDFNNPLNFMQLLWHSNSIVCYISSSTSAGKLFRRAGGFIIHILWRWQPNCGSWLYSLSLLNHTMSPTYKSGNLLGLIYTSNCPTVNGPCYSIAHLWFPPCCTLFTGFLPT